MAAATLHRTWCSLERQLKVAGATILLLNGLREQAVATELEQAEETAGYHPVPIDEIDRATIMEFATHGLKPGQNGKTIYNKLVADLPAAKAARPNEDPQRERLAELRPDGSADL
jgi:hypothetical protein